MRKMQLTEPLLFLPSLLSCLSRSWSAPIKITFKGCTTGTDGTTEYYCCPVEAQRPILDFKPGYNPSKPLRNRKAVQCLSVDELSVYKTKLEKAYRLMRALPPNDPRSFYQQDVMHCAHATESLHYAGASIDVHFNWLFLPWHRWYSHFQERILQSLLDDPTFTMHFWNWENGGSPYGGHGGCWKAGNKFPEIYADRSSPLFHPNRSVRALTSSLIVDLAISKLMGNNPTEMDVFPEDVMSARNSQVMHDSLVTIPTSRDLFFGKPVRAGDEKSESYINDMGSLEGKSHSTVHFWVGGDMVSTVGASKDPIFHAHHWNVDRLWYVWHRLGPGRVDPEDIDFLDAEFLFYDENADLRRVNVRDSLDHRVLGYDFEDVNDASWNFGKVTSNLYNPAISKPSVSVLASEARTVPE